VILLCCFKNIYQEYEYTSNNKCYKCVMMYRDMCVMMYRDMCVMMYRDMCVMICVS